MRLPRNQVLFRPLPSEEYTPNGLFVPENARSISNKGTIVSVGSGTKKTPMRLKEGLTVHRVKDWGEPIEVDGVLHFIMDERAIIAIE